MDAQDGGRARRLGRIGVLVWAREIHHGGQLAHLLTAGGRHRLCSWMVNVRRLVAVDLHSVTLAQTAGERGFRGGWGALSDMTEAPAGRLRLPILKLSVRAAGLSAPADAEARLKRGVVAHTQRLGSVPGHRQAPSLIC